MKESYATVFSVLWGAWLAARKRIYPYKSAAASAVFEVKEKSMAQQYTPEICTFSFFLKKENRKMTLKLQNEKKIFTTLTTDYSMIT